MAITDNLTVTSVQARKALLKAFKAKRPVFLWGPHDLRFADAGRTPEKHRTFCLECLEQCLAGLHRSYCKIIRNSHVRVSYQLMYR